jgi:acetoin utilization deacetylase AcuC-like enzyme
MNNYEEMTLLDWLKQRHAPGLTAYITHPECMEHNVGEMHPESPARLIAIRDQLKASQIFDSLDEIEAPQASDEQIARVHTPRYIEYLELSQPLIGTTRVDSDTAMSPATLRAARRAAGAVIKAVDLVCEKKVPNAFCAIRPPGHHAESAKAMGFCFFNNIAIGIRHALAAHGIERAAIIDFDVHHGNGTEEIFRDEDRVLMCSIFQHPFFPYSGDAPMGPNMVNVPMKAGSSGAEFRKVVEDIWLPRLLEFQPQILFISAGFDAHREDEMGSMGLVEADYEWVTRKLCEFAAEHCEGRIVSVLEGGYDLSALARSATAHIKILSGA